MDKIEVLERLEHFKWTDTITFPRKEGVFKQVGDEMQLGGYRVDQECLSRIAPYIEVPFKFLRKCPIGTQAEIMDHFYMQTIPSPITLVNDGDVVAFAGRKENLIDPDRVVDLLSKAIGTLDFGRVHTANGVASIYCVGPRQSEVSVGDIVNHGVSVTFSPWAVASTEVVGYMNRLVCSNGMLGAQDLTMFKRRVNGGSDGDVYEWLYESVAGSYSMVDLEVDRLRNLMEIELNGNRNEAIEHVLMQLPMRLREFVRHEILQRDPKNMYELTCIVTEIGTHRMESHQHARTLMSAAGSLSGHFEHCPVCRRVM